MLLFLKISPVFHCRCKFILMRRMASFNLTGESWKNICFTLKKKKQKKRKPTQEYDFLAESGLMAVILYRLNHNMNTDPSKWRV